MGKDKGIPQKNPSLLWAYFSFVQRSFPQAAGGNNCESARQSATQKPGVE